MTTNDTDRQADDDADRNDVRRRALLARPLTLDDTRPLSAAVSVEIAATSRRGAARTYNDDHHVVLRSGRSLETLATSLSSADIPGPFVEYGYGMLIADGLGEAGAGSVASRAALSAMVHMALEQGKWHLRIEPDTAAEVINRMQHFYSQVDLDVFAKSMEGPLLKGIATSLTSALSAGDSLFVAHVGHSRAYLHRNGILTQLTRDHTMASHLATSKGPVAVERRGQDQQHILTDALGAGGGTPPVDIEQFRLIDGDVLLLCTNGLTDVIDNRRIAEVLARPRQPAEQCAMLTDLAVQAATEDNITVVLAHYQIPAR